MAIKQLITLENVLINSEYKISPSIYITPIVHMDTKLEGVKLFRGFIKSKFNKLFIESGVSPDIVVGVVLVKKEFLYFTYKPILKEVDFSLTSSEMAPFIYIPVDKFKKANSIECTIGLLGVFASRLDILEDKLAEVSKSFSEEFNKIVVFTTGNMSNKSICEIIRKRFPYVDYVYVSRKDLVDFFNIRKKEYGFV